MVSEDPWESLRPFRWFYEVFPFPAMYPYEAGFSFLRFSQNNVLQQMECKRKYANLAIFCSDFKRFAKV